MAISQKEISEHASDLFANACSSALSLLLSIVAWDYPAKKLKSSDEFLFSDR
jgi:hypothetical protein